MRTEYSSRNTVAELMMAAELYMASFLALLLLLPVVVISAAAAGAASYETKSIDPGLVVMTLPEPVSGPESLAFDSRGRGPYSGVSDGRVLRWQGRRQGWTEFAYNYKHKSVAICAADKKLVVPESVCGRPLGLQFHRDSGDLYVADAYMGLLRVPARGGLAEVVATEAGGVPFNFLNGLDVDQRTGDVYFTDSSTTYRRSDYLLVVALGDATGRLVRYDRRARRVTVLHADLSYPNGVAVSGDGTHVVVAHTALCELRRYWVRGPRAGRSETFAELPGYPDNVRPDGRGGYWVALSKGVADLGGGAAVAAPTVAVKVDADGKVAEALDGFSFVSVSEVAERNGTLWVGSVDTPYAGELKGHSSW
ncbi:protein STRICTOSIDINE SYNTHASE-LIKE 10-like [Phragmites australis]|uniref:protein STRICTOSIDINE SYNTHASE-LIKE 10-like n=1 Tax=Phragmites australis TaxID=29695 RepID=UPI002D76860F|nr:protein STRICTOSIDINE SYNTHASE-LIKE 10-like [Phragmites australis]